MKYVSLLLFFWLICTGTYAQYENIWAFGDNAGIDFNNMAMPVKTAISGYGEGNAAVCDNNGRLLFYTNGYKVWDGNGNIMPGGEGIISDPILPPLPLPGGQPPDYASSTTQGALIVPMPGDGRKYYVFSMTCVELGITDNGLGRMYYSVVDMDRNGGLGDIDPVRKSILVDKGHTEALTAVVGDRCNVWLLAINRVKNELKAYSIDDNGISPVPVLSPLLDVNQNAAFGNIVASSDRRTLAIARWGVGIYDFDPVTGRAVGRLALAPAYSAVVWAYNTCFSPDNSKLYVSFGPVVVGVPYSFQYDLSSGDSATMTASRKPLNNPDNWSFKLGPDGRVYGSSRQNALNVINEPNLQMPACRYNPGGFLLAPGTGVSFAFTNAVAAMKKDTAKAAYEVEAACFASFERLEISHQDGWDYEWNTGARGTELKVERPGVYWARYYTAPCTWHADSFRVSFSNGVLPHIDTRNSCGSQANGAAWASTYDDDTVMYRYRWYDKDHNLLSDTDSLINVPPGNYMLSVSTAECDTTLVLEIRSEMHKLSFTTDSITCQGAELVFKNTSDPDYARFSWDFGDHSVSALRDPRHVYQDSGAYTVQLRGQGAVCTDTLTMEVVVDPRMASNFRADKDSICAGESVFFSAPADHPAIVSRLWHFGDDMFISVDGVQGIRHAFESGGLIRVQLLTRFRACPDTSAKARVYVQSLPVVNLGVDSVLCWRGVPIDLRNRANGSASGESFYSFWNTGDTTEVFRAVHPGVYTLTMVSGFLGCHNSESVAVIPGCHIDMPNAFTPNGDGINDYFFPRQLLAKQVTSFRMQVLDRWGNVVFETNHTDGRGWDGQYGGSALPEGVYTYLVDLETGGKRERYQGNVTVLR